MKKLTDIEVQNLIVNRETSIRVSNSKKRYALGKTMTHALLITWLLIALYPFIWSVFTSFKDKYLIEETGFNPLPKSGEWTTSNYSAIFSPTGAYAKYLPTWMFNSVVFTFTTAITNSFLAVLGGYVLSGSRMRGKNILIKYFLVSILVPMQATIVPTLFIFDKFGVVGVKGSYFGFLLMMIFSSAIGIHNTLFARQFFQTQSREMEEAGRLDGYSTLSVFRKVTFKKMLPLAAMIFVMSFLGAWNNFFLFQLLAQDDPYKMSLVSAIYYVSSEGASSRADGRALSLALSNISFVPIFIVYLFTVRIQIRGIKGGNK